MEKNKTLEKKQIRESGLEYKYNGKEYAIS